MTVLVLSQCPGCSQPVAMVVRGETTSWLAFDRSLLICPREGCFPKISHILGGDGGVRSCSWNSYNDQVGGSLLMVWGVIPGNRLLEKQKQNKKTDALDPALSVNSYNDLVSLSHA